MPKDKTIETTGMWPATVQVLALGIVGAAATIGLLLLGGSSSSASIRLLRQEEAKLWVTVVAAQAGFWAAAARYVWPKALEYLPPEEPKARKGLRERFRSLWHRLRPLGPRGASVVAVLFLLFVVPLAASLIAGNVNPLWGSGWKVPILTLIAFSAVGLPSFLGIASVQVECIGLGRTIEDADIEDFIRLREDLNRFLTLLGFVIGLAVLAAGTLRKAVLAANPHADFPAVNILVYAAFLTLLLAFIYAPAHGDLLRWGRRIRDRLLAPRPNPQDDKFREWFGKRADLGELLQIDVTTYQRLQSAVFILSPLITAAVSLAIPKTE